MELYSERQSHGSGPDIGMIGVRSILLALSFRVKKVRKYVAYYFPVAEKFFV